MGFSAIRPAENPGSRRCCRACGKGLADGAGVAVGARTFRAAARHVGRK
jgi:hypothetical protein